MLQWHSISSANLIIFPKMMQEIQCFWFGRSIAAGERVAAVAQHARFALLMQWFSKSSALSVGGEWTARHKLFSSDLLHKVFLHCCWVDEAIVPNLLQFSERRKRSTGGAENITSVHAGEHICFYIFFSHLFATPCKYSLRYRVLWGWKLIAPKHALVFLLTNNIWKAFGR